jgi:hypothetical protein
MILAILIAVAALAAVLWTITHTLTWSLTRGNENLSNSVAVANQGDVNIDVDQATNQTNTPIGLVLDVSQLKSLYILTSVDMTLKTNSTSAPDTTIALKSGKPFVWESSAGYFTNPFGSTDVTVAYLTNTTAGSFQLRAVVDATP